MTRSPRTEDDTEVFSGPTVDAALRAARAAHGPHVEVVRAMRVLSGVRGLLGQARFSVVVRRPPVTEVTVLPIVPDAPARPRPSSGSPDDVLRGVLDDLLEAAEHDERSAAEPEDGGWWWAQQGEIEHLLAELGERVAPDAARHPAPGLARHGDDDLAPPHLALEAGALLDAAEGRSDLALLDAQEPEAPVGPGWDREELRRLGVPTEVLSRLPVEDPSDDAGWRRALVEAIGAAVPAPSLPDAQHPVVMSGHGLLGAIAVLRAALEDGATPGTLGHEGRYRPATPAAFVDVLAASVRS